MLHASASVYSQKAKLTVVLENASIEQVLKTIQEQSEFDFFYKIDQIPRNKRVSLQYQDVQIEKILDYILDGTGLKYHIIDDDIVISPSSNNVSHLRQVLISPAASPTPPALPSPE